MIAHAAQRERPREGRSQRFDFHAMGGPCALHLRAERCADLRAAAHAAIGEVRRIEAKYSRYRDASVVARINAAAGSGRCVEVDDETLGLLDFADRLHRESGCRFDATAGVLRRVWNFKSGRLPTHAAVAALRPLIGWQQVERRGMAFGLPRAGMEIDFGGFGKEYAADRAAALCRSAGVEAGVVDLAGDLALIADVPRERPLRVGVRDPRAPERAVAHVGLCRGAIATSGDYERSMVVAGRRYSHLLDARSGWPVERTFSSVTVIAEHCLVAGAATTIALLLGEDEGGRFLEALGLPSLRVHADGSLSGRLAESPLRSGKHALGAQAGAGAGAGAGAVRKTR